MESVFKNSGLNTIRELFKGSSYLNEFLETLNDSEQQDLNVIIRIYDFKYENKIKSAKEEIVILRIIPFFNIIIHLIKLMKKSKKKD